VTARRLRILVVDDYPDAAASLTALLDLWGYEARAVTSGVEALEVVAGWQPDIALVDIAMPVMTGFELAQRLSAGPGPRPVLVAVTGLGQPGDVERVLASGFDRHFLKPVDPDRLAAYLHRHAANLRTG
jgi:CheY-like chemotaxis protein